MNLSQPMTKGVRHLQTVSRSRAHELIVTGVIPRDEWCFLRNWYKFSLTPLLDDGPARG
jgi:hypothetical protein